MRIEFTQQLALRATHEFVGGAACEDISFVLSARARQLVAAAGGVVRAAPGRLALFVARGERGALLRGLSEEPLRIGVIAAPVFDNYSEPPVDPGFVALYRPNVAGAGLLPPLRCHVAGERLRYALEEKARPVRVVVRGATAEHAVDLAADAEPVAAFDLAAEIEGVHRVVEVRGGVDDVERPLVLDASLAALAPLAVVVAPLAGAARSFELAFSARRQPLRFFVTARAADDLADIAVVAKPNGAVVEFEEVLTADLNPRERAAAAGGSLRVFRSKQPEPRSATAQHKLALQRDGAELIPRLPHAGAASAAADVFVDITTPKGN